MAVLGKRKAPQPSISEEDANEIFRRHFEAQFRPVAEAAPTGAATAGSDDEDLNDSDGQDEDSEEDSEWGGLSDDDANGVERTSHGHVVEVVDHSSSQPSKPTPMTKRELRDFMSSRPPDQTASPKAPPPTTKPTTSLPEDAPSLLAQDLELRRLLAESHLLATPTLIAGAEPLPFAAGRTRRKATDLRVQALGSKASILTQQKMPMNMRKGIVAAKTTRESKRRREAKENGVILEREAPVNKGRKKQKGMDPAVDRPGVGRLRGAQLRVSERDVKMIEGTRDTFGRRGRR